MKIDKKKALLVVLPLCVIFVTLLVLFSIFDLQISKAVVHLGEGEYLSNNIFGRIFETIGETPIYLVTVFAGALLFHNGAKRKNGTFKIIAMIFAVIVMVGMSTYMIKKVIGYIQDHFGIGDSKSKALQYLVYVAFGFAFSSLVVYVTNGLKRATLNKLLVWSVIVILTAAISQLIAQGIKLFAGRARFRTMHVLENFDLYTPWFKFNGHRKPTSDMIILGVASDGFRSFPSGHTAAAAMLIALTALPKLLMGDGAKNKKLVTVISWIVSCALILTVAISRIIVGAHFASDVLIGCAITVLSYIVAIPLGKIVTDKLLKIRPLQERPVIVEESL